MLCDGQGKKELGIFKENRKRQTNVCGATALFILLIVCGYGYSKNIRPVAKLPAPGFKVDYMRSEPDRPVREYDGKYEGPIIDTHAHLDPARSGYMSKKSLRRIAESINGTGVDMIIIMPVPNEGHMTKRSTGAKQRKKLMQLEEKRIRLFCGSEYISNWLHDAYRHGFKERDLNKVLNRLSEDLDDPECLGIGEIGLTHFNKDGIQNVIEYPPTFEPFLKIVGRIEKKEGWIDLHAEPVDPFGTSHENQVFGGVELLFQKHPNLKLILSHTAMTNPANVRRILMTYPNIMLNFKPIKRHGIWRNLEPITDTEGRLYNDWGELFEEMPKRFMVGTDEKFGRIGKGVHAPKGAKVAKYEKKIRRIRKILGCIRPEAAELIAYKNARRIFK
jgi:hypothetical protein